MADNMQKKEEKGEFRRLLREKLFEGNSRSSKYFEIILLIIILASVTAVMLETIDPIKARYGPLLVNMEWFFTIIFTIEYFLRFFSASHKSRYVFSAYGLIDLVSILPLYISIFFKGKEVLQLVRILRLVRVVSRMAAISRRVDNTTKILLPSNQHLAAGEKVLFQFRQTRKRYFFRYLGLYCIIMISIWQIFMDHFKSFAFDLAAYIMFMLATYIILKHETRTWSERYVITNRRLFRSVGLISEEFKSTSYKFVSDISLSQSIYGKIFNMGTVYIKTTGSEDQNVTLHDVSNPLFVKRLIQENITKDYS